MGRRRRDAGGVHGILLVDKPVGPTSHDLVGWVRRLVGSRRVGHCGTLDPAASGLLVIAVGVATRAVSLMSSADKTYRAEVILGRKTDSGDREGRVLEEVEVSPEIAEAAIEAAYGLIGDHQIAPPAYSAPCDGGCRCRVCSSCIDTEVGARARLWRLAPGACRC